MNAETISQWNAKRGMMLACQTLAYALFIVTGVIWAIAGAGAGIIADILTIVLMVAVLAVFHWFWPFRATIIDRAIGCAAGLLSIVVVASPAAGNLLVPMSEAIERSPLQYEMHAETQWAAAVAGLLVLLTIVSFARQMLREERSHLIRALSHCVTGGAASIALAGWYFIPYVVAGAYTLSPALFAGIIVAMVLFALVLAFGSVWWLKELDPDPAIRAPWVGVAMLPVMLYGLVVFAAALVVQLAA